MGNPIEVFVAGIEADCCYPIALSFAALSCFPKTGAEGGSHVGKLGVSADDVFHVANCFFGLPVLIKCEGVVGAGKGVFGG